MSAQYLDHLRLVFPHRTDAEIELICSGSREIQKRTGRHAHDHRKAAMQALFPSRTWHDWRDDRVLSVQFCLERRIQELCWIGSSNSNKSADMADVALALWWTKPELTSVYVTSPYETATELGLWAYICEQFDEARSENPGLPGKRRLSDNSIILHERNPRSFIRLATVDQIGKLVGKKSVKMQEGLLILLVDEFPAFTPMAARNLIAVLANVWSVENLLVIFAGNFASTGDGLGIVCDPDELDIPGGYEGFDPDRHYRWRTKRGGLCLRFDGLQSPNVKAGKDIYPFLTTLDYIGKLAKLPGGLQSPSAMRFIRSAPITSLAEFTILSSERIRAGGCYDPYTFTGDDLVKGMFCDPGFGGDPCAIQKFKFGYTQLADGGRRQTLVLWDEPYYIPIRVGMKNDAEELVTAAKQVALGMKEHAAKHHIPAENCGYDGSLRAELAQQVALLFSPQVRAIDSQGPATERPVSAIEVDDNGQPIPWNKKVDRFISELWFALASAVDAYQVRGLQLAAKAVAQLCARQWHWQGKNKRSIETKKEYKDRLREEGKPVESPNEADALVGCLEVARQLGFSLEGLRPEGGSLQLILDMIRERSIRREIRQVMHPTLPSGRLHAIQRLSLSNSGRLNR